MQQIITKNTKIFFNILKFGIQQCQYQLKAQNEDRECIYLEFARKL
jgi:hypothetical protein